MAAKIEYVVVEGCIQEGAKVFRKGEVYVPASKELAEDLIDTGKIAPRGKLPAKDELDEE